MHFRGTNRGMSAVFGDILSLEVDAIVNPAHEDLLGGGGLDGMIHDAAGPALLEACRALGGCEVGLAKATPGFDLSARWIIHTVGPIWRGGSHGEADLLSSCYARSLDCARGVGARSVAIPGISTGLHGFPSALAAPIAVDTVREWLAEGADASVQFVCFDRSTIELYEALLA
jgi:O-acetyl-ADP-ribose deacetylase